MQVIFIAWGGGIAPGSRLGKISNLDVASTIAAILGLEMKPQRAMQFKDCWITATINEDMQDTFEGDWLSARRLW